MQKNKLNILSTRPLDEKIIQEANAQDIHIDCLSFIETEAIQDQGIQEQVHDLQAKNITAVFTSMNAVEAVKAYLTSIPNWTIYSIGQTTKELIEEAFGKTIKATADNASLLADAIIADQQQEVYFFCGDQRREELPEKLKAAGVVLHELIVYKTMQQPLPVQKEYDGILFFSPSAVHSFFLANHLTEQAVPFAIGSTTAEAIKQYTNNPIQIADRPGKEALVHIMMDYFSTIQKQQH